MKIHRILMAVVLCGGPSFAQGTPPPPAAPGAPATPPAAPADEPGLKIRGLYFQLDAPLPDVYAHDPSMGGKVPGVKMDVKTYLNHEFSVLPFKGDSFVFTKSADATSPTNAANVLAKVKLPANFKNGIFMFLPGSGKTGDPPYRVLVIEDSNRVFPPGSFKVLNLSPHAVRVQLEKDVHDLRSGETKVIEDPPVGANNLSGMRAFTYKDGSWQRFAATNWPHPGEKRSIQLIFENPQSKQVEIRGIRDVSGSLE